MRITSYRIGWDNVKGEACFSADSFGMTQGHLIVEKFQAKYPRNNYRLVKESAYRRIKENQFKSILKDNPNPEE